MKKEVSTTPIILVMIVFIGSVIYLLESAAFGGRQSVNGNSYTQPDFQHHPDKLTRHVMRVVKPDSLQFLQIKELTSRSADQLKKINRNSRQEKEIIIDSLKQQLREILTDEQFKRLDETEIPLPRAIE